MFFVQVGASTGLLFALPGIIIEMLGTGKVLRETNLIRILNSGPTLEMGLIFGCLSMLSGFLLAFLLFTAGLNITL